MNVDSLTARAEVGERHLIFEMIFCQHRLRVAFVGLEPAVLGSVIYLDTNQPGLRVCAPPHVEWASQHYEAIIGEAKRIWAMAVRECSG